MMNMGRLVVRIRSITTGRRSGTSLHRVRVTPRAAPPAGKLDLNAVVTISRSIKGLAFQYEHDRCCGIDTTIGRVTDATGKYVYPATSNDIVDAFRLNYSGIKGVSVSLATQYRFRHDNTATNDPTNLAPADWHQQSLTLGYTLPAIAALNGTTIGISATGVMNKHHVSAAGLAAEEAAGFTDSDGKTRYGVNYGPNINIPVSKGFAVFGSASYGAFDYFDNAPVPFYYDIIDFGIYKKFNSLLSLTADLNNLTQDKTAAAGRSCIRTPSTVFTSQSRWTSTSPRNNARRGRVQPG